MDILDIYLAFRRATEEMRSSAGTSLCMIERLCDGRVGTGVLVDRKTVLTAHHNFVGTTPKNCRIYFAQQARDVRISNAKHFPEADLTALTLRTPAPGAPAEIDYETPPRIGLLVGLPSFWDKRDRLIFCPTKPTARDFRLVKGIMLFPKEAITMTDNTLEEGLFREDVDTYHARARRGNSGAGIFLQDGRLFSILCTGNSTAFSSPTAHVFREFVKTL